MTESNCQVCHTPMAKGLELWHQRCLQCGYERGDLEPNISNKLSVLETLDENQRESGLKQLRVNNFQTITANLVELSEPNARLLEVGCAHGWFLEAADGHFTATGIEPDDEMFELCQSNGRQVRHGFFPDILANDERYDVIVFNDVFEHIPNANTTLNACHKHLNDNGLLLINLPSSRGVIYRASKILKTVGVSSFFNRLWQKDMPSPHLHYFDSANLSQLLAQHQFELTSCHYLNTLSLSGLYNRITYARRERPLVSLLVYLCAVAVLPALKLLPKDIVYLIARKKERQAITNAPSTSGEK